MAPPPGLFSTMTGWPRLSDNFCPYTRAMISLPPPALKPTMMWIGRVGYFAGCSCASADVVASAIDPAQRPADKSLRTTVMDRLPSKRRNVNMQHGSLAVIKRSQTAIDRISEIIRLGHAFAMRAERPRHAREI